MNKFLYCHILILFLISIQANAQDFDALMRSANNLMSEEKYEEALVVFKDMLALEESDSVRLSWINGYTGICMEELGREDDAVSYYKKAIDLQFPNYSIYDKLYSIAKTRKDYALQRFVLEAKLYMFPEQEPASLKSLCYVLANLRDYKNLVSTADKALQFDPQNFKYYYFKGLSYQHLKDIEKASESYEYALALKPDDHSSNMNLGLMLYNQISAKFEAENKKYNSLAKPTRVEYTAYTKATEALKKDYLKAEPYLVQAFIVKPNTSLNKALYNLYVRTGQKEKIESFNLTAD